MTVTQNSKKDHWSSKAYNTSASFVPKLATTVYSYLDPQPTDSILDIGCGDGPLTAQIAGAVSSGRVLGLDASPSMIQTAQKDYAPSKHPNLIFQVADCTKLSKEVPEVLDGSFDKVFSNAAYHWILRNPETRKDVFSDAFKALKPGGSLVFEMGGAGNVAEVRSTIIAALAMHGVLLDEARKADPWFFPSEKWMSAMLEDVGFQVERVELEYRPTRLTDHDEGGLEGWVRLFGAQLLETVSELTRAEVVRWVVEVLRSSCQREEDGSWWIGYVRLRAVAKKPQH
ncbi:S-adenosyl-L-methionine-dependent methyltransferase [Phyllosticta capitalensis]|uniref:S-adenosyl-L-methionine-dependent methyltransferase n=1 Tax=Phyllosticta capitalensis TaxID=121624 RepID=UPI00312D0C2D